MKTLRIGLDIDDVIARFWRAYTSKFGFPSTDGEVTRHVMQDLKWDREFWLNLELIQKPFGFDPVLYCTKRVIPKKWTREYLDKHNIGSRSNGSRIPVYQQYYQCGKKSSLIKGKVDVFIDDSISNFIELNLAGVPCLLMNTEINFDWGPIGRVYSLDYDEIEDTYDLLRNTVGGNFCNLL